jgi:hypothetical protein
MTVTTLWPPRVARFISPAVLHFHPTLPVHITSDAPDTSSNGAALLLRQMDERLGLTTLLSLT